jgi:hypothetical protein
MRSAGALLGLFVIASLAFTACDGDDDTIGNAGSGGTAAKGGKGGSGTGGSNAGEGATGGTSAASGGTGGSSAASGGTGGTSAGNGGTSSGRGGSSARGGSSGKGGSSSGTAGDGASGASAGEGGATGGTPGVGGTGIIGMGGAGAGGEAGSTGGEAGGDTGPAPTPKACTYECTIDTDCDPDHGYTCVDGLCLDAERSCNAHEECVAWATGLTEPCNEDTDCVYNADFGGLCINVAGSGLCVMVPYGGDCAFGAATEAQKNGSTDTATVCLDLSGRCDAHQCFRGCTSDPNFCTTPPNNKRGPLCDAVTGKCGGCTGDGQCGGSGTSHCDLATGVCGCQSDDECGALAGMDTCVAGKCSCSATSCTTFPDATAVCR